MKILASALLAWSAFGSFAHAAERPNIVFIFSDDHALESISAYGDRFDEVAPTPNLDRIANEGMIFNRSYCTNSICGPSRASIITGKHSHLNGYMDNNFSLFDGNQQTFPKLLQKAGYETAIIGKWHLVTDPTGFDHWEVLPGQGNYYNPDFLQMDGTTKRVEGYVTDIVTDKSIEWLERRKDKTKPFVLMCQQKAPHRNWVPAERHFHLFDGMDLPEPKSLFDDYSGRIQALGENEMQISDHFQWTWDMLLPGEPKDPRFVDIVNTSYYDRMTQKQKKAFDDAFGPENDRLYAELAKGMSDKELTKWKYQRYIKNYLRCIRALDENVGRVLDYLDDNGLAENTIVIYSSDQGFYLGEHGWYDKRWMFEESLSMPFIIRWPGKIAPGSKSDALIQNIDYAPTFLDVAGAPIPDDIQGRSLVPILKNSGEAPTSWREAIYYQYSGEGTHGVPTHDGVRDSHYKLMYFPTSDEWMLFDLLNDPEEMKNIAAENDSASVLAQMKETYAKLKKKYKATPSTVPRQRYDTPWWKERWRKQFKAMDKQADTLVVFLGDSITQHWENTGKKIWERHFAPLGAVNWGYGGDRTEHLIWRLQNGNIERLSPKVAVLLIGTNNTGHEERPAEDTAAGIKQALDELSWKWPETKVILMAAFPRGASPDGNMRKINDQINLITKTYADGERIHHLDINEKFLDKDGFLSKDAMPDLLHLSEESYEIWADALGKKLAELGVE